MEVQFSQNLVSIRGGGGRTYESSGVLEFEHAVQRNVAIGKTFDCQ